MTEKHPPKPNHVSGVAKGEERVKTKGKEPGRTQKEENDLNRGKPYRTSRDSTGISPESRKPIVPGSADIPPA